MGTSSRRTFGDSQPRQVRQFQLKARLGEEDWPARQVMYPLKRIVLRRAGIKENMLDTH